MIVLTNLKEASQGFLEKLGTFKDPKESLELLLKHIRQEAISASKQAETPKNPLEIPNLDFLTTLEMLEHLAGRYRSMVFAAATPRNTDGTAVETIRYVNGDLLQCSGLGNVIAASCIQKLYEEGSDEDSDFNGVPNE